MTVERADAVRKAEVLVEALPFIRKFHGDTIVVKLGGSSMEEAKANVLEDIVLLRYVGMNPVVVHGGGREITAWQQKMGIESRFVDGLRVTDEDSIEVVKMVLTGKVNPELVSALNALGGQAVGMSGEDGPCILVRPAASGNGEDLGLVGDVAQQLLQCVYLDALHRSLVASRQLVDGAHARILAAFGDAYAVHAFGMPLQHDAHRVHAVDRLGALHCSLCRRPSGRGYASCASARSTRPSMGFTAVTSTRTCAPVRSRRPVRRPRQA